MSQALAVYRLLLRSINTAFRQDSQTIHRARQEVRSKFQESAGVTDSSQLQQMYKDGREAASFLQTYVVQAELNERGNYAMRLEPQHADTTAEEGALRPPKRAK